MKNGQELSKFLIERGIFSYGRSFGRSQIDIYIENEEDTFFIEAKIYKGKPSKTSVKKNLAQLESYRDQLLQEGKEVLSQMSKEQELRGILLILNKSDIYIDAPRKWLQGRIWILVINLGVPPSERKGHISLREANNPNDFIEISLIKS